MSRNAQNLQEKENGTQEELPANMRNADYFIFGKMDTFSRPPVTDFALENLFYMEAFSIFTCPKGFFTNRKDYQSFLIIYTYEGNGALEYMGKSYSLGPGDGFFIDCRVPHLYRTVGDVWKHGVFHLNGPLVPALFSRYMENGSVSFISLLPAIIKRSWRNCYPFMAPYSPAGTGWLPIVSAVSLPIFSGTRPRKKKQTPRYRKICGI